MSQMQNYVEEHVFRFFLDLEIQKAIRLQYCVSVVCLTPDLEHATADAVLIRRLAETSLSLLRATDVATTFSDTTNSIGLLLIDAEPRSLPRILDRVTEHKVLADGIQEERLSWSAGGGSYPQTVTDGRDLLRQAIGLMTRAKTDGGNRFYLPS